MHKKVAKLFHTRQGFTQLTIYTLLISGYTAAKFIDSIKC